MEFLNSSLLSILIWLPTAGALVVLLQKDRFAARRLAVATTAVTFACSLLLFATFNWHGVGAAASTYAYAPGANHGVAESPTGTVQMLTAVPWIPSFNIYYRLGIDGLSFPLVLLSTFIFLLSAIASWNIDKMTKGYFALFLFLQTGVLGTFLALDFFLFYVFFEVSLLPMYFLIGIWGGPRKEYAAIKFFLYTLLGSVCLLIVLIGLHLYSRGLVTDPTTGINGTFDLVQFASPRFQSALAHALPAGLTGATAKLFFLLLMVGFLIKVPAVPFHTWLPDAHVEAPTPVSMILAAILLKFGGYGIFRLAYPLFPEAAKHLWLLIAIIGVVSIIYGALCAMAQTDFKKLVAYSSVSHMGFVTLGAAMMTTASVNGALFMMVAHGVTSAMMFFIVGVLYDRAHHRELSRLGGIATTMPLYTGFSTVGIFATLGLPGLCGFIGEVMVLLGSFQAAKPDSILMSSRLATPSAIYTLAVIACLGIILTAAYMLWTLQRVYLGPEKPEYQSFPEVSAREIGVLTPLTVLAILLGILPTVFFFTFTDTTVNAFFTTLTHTATTALTQLPL